VIPAGRRVYTRRRIDRARTQLVADVAHELNAPLTAMRGYVETLRSPELRLDAERRDWYLATVERETRRLQRIVADLRALSRFADGAVRLDRRVFSIARLFEHVRQRHEQDASRRNVRFFVCVDHAAAEIEADPDRLEQAIDNLVSNAVRHTPGGGVVELRAHRPAAGIRVSVIDSGPGIPARHLARVFERYYKVEPPSSGEAGGSGLGLAIAQAIVERHGGALGVTSAPGRTEFAIDLPVQSASTNL